MLQDMDGGVHLVIQWSLWGSYICSTTTSLDTFDTSLLLRLCTTCWVPKLLPLLVDAKWASRCMLWLLLYCTVQILKYVPGIEYHWLLFLEADWVPICGFQWSSWLHCSWQLEWCLFGTIQLEDMIFLCCWLITKKSMVRTVFSGFQTLLAYHCKTKEHLDLRTWTLVISIKRPALLIEFFTKLALLSNRSAFYLCMATSAGLSSTLSYVHASA